MFTLQFWQSAQGLAGTPVSSSLEIAGPLLLLCRYVHAIVTHSDGLGKAACEKSLVKVRYPSTLPSQIVKICGRTKHSNIFEISDWLVLFFVCPPPPIFITELILPTFSRDGYRHESSCARSRIKNPRFHCKGLEFQWLAHLKHFTQLFFREMTFVPWRSKSDSWRL